ncbi:MAG TPA: prepilin peptidase [Clostridiales bacterium]|jgi:Flp pilus assembly protein protease CpaA|nr:prepilin peptidase [Clostridiales bacterium]
MAAWPPKEVRKYGHVVCPDTCGAVYLSLCEPYSIIEWDAVILFGDRAKEVNEEVVALMIACGAAAGLAALPLTKKLISERCETVPGHAVLSHRLAPYFWCLFCAAWFVLIYYAGGGVLERAEYITVFLICLIIGAVDLVIKKIPNSMILALITSKIIFLSLRFDIEEIRRSLWGFLAAAVIFAIPTFFKISVGAGDMKLAAVAGFYLGVGGFLQAMVIMAALMSIYGICILIRRVGNLRTKTAMGPYLAIGLILSLIFPLI